ncbi:MAG: ABC transporter permease [Bacteroidales bacterium]|nr:ABC transporter permease [Bacteroidales bacterium]
MRPFVVLLQKEFIKLGRDSFLPKLIIILPILIMLFAPLLVTMDVRNVKVAVVDLDHSTTSHRIMSHISAAEDLILYRATAEFELAMRDLEDGNVDIIVQIPKRFERDMTLSTPQKISIMANAVNATKGSMGTQYIAQTIARALTEVSNEKSMERMPELITVQNRFNPTLNYSHFMIPALMIIIFILVCGFLPGLSIVEEKEMGTIEQINVSPVNRFHFTLSKLIPYWLIGIFALFISMLIVKFVYKLSPTGSVGTIYFGAFLFILTISGLSLTIANFSDTLQQLMFVLFFFIMIFIMMSGLLTPIDSMPKWAQIITYALPPRYFIDILRSVYLKGTTIAEQWENFVALGAFSVIFNILAAITYKKQA